MTSARPIFVLLGFASEYSLSAIARMLREIGEIVVEVDFSVSGVPDMGDAAVVLITSQHPALTAWIFKYNYGVEPVYCRYSSPMECLTRLNVCCSVFVPHDLEQPILAYEIGYMSFFDIYCSPYESNPGLAMVCQPLYTGWAKHVNIEPGGFVHQQAASSVGVFFVNQLIDLVHRGGVPYLLSEYALAVDRGIPFKLPSWPGVADIEKRLSQAGVKVIPSDTLSTHVIAHSSQIFSNARGSVLAEAAYLGVPAHIIAPRATELPASSPRRWQRRPFDFQLLMKAIQNHLDETSRP